MTSDEIALWFTDLSPWGWVGLVVVALLFIFFLRNLPDLFRYIKISSM